ncbi:MAG: hypothetical protein JXA96_05130 [Sedimentisphaerales bacterium]|nr:hypothetical protein [Sedimentisphaerales bacterium]
MKISEEMFEVLIGKYLDGEITPSEQILLEAKLNSDPKASELLEQYQDLHEQSSEVLAVELLEKGKSSQEIFEKAFQQSKYKSHHIIKLGGWIRFATGVAAGLIFGIALHFILLQTSSGRNELNPARPAPGTPTYVKKINDDILFGPSQPLTQPSVVPVRNVDWYNFTDENGNQWVVEGVRENSVRPAVYEQGI